MQNVPNFVEKIEATLADRERELLTLRETVWQFLGTDHSSRDTKKYQEIVRQAELQVGATLRTLLDQSDKSEAFKEAANRLCQNCRSLQDYTTRMSNELAVDLAERRHVEKNATMDVVKNVGFFLAVPAAFITAVKNGVGEGVVNVTEATVAGVSFSASVLARKRILQLFGALGKTASNTPDQLRNSFLLYYVKETAEENGMAVLRTASSGFRKINSTIRKAKP